MTPPLLFAARATRTAHRLPSAVWRPFGVDRSARRLPAPRPDGDEAVTASPSSPPGYGDFLSAVGAGALVVAVVTVGALVTARRRSAATRRRNPRADGQSQLCGSAGSIHRIAEFLAVEVP
jgi:hypothetical protein